MTDQEHIKEAYATLVEAVFKAFFTSFTSAQGNSAAETAAEDRFKEGIRHARHVRDRAIALLPQE